MPGGNQANPLIVGSVSRLVDKTLAVPVGLAPPGQAACALAMGGAGKVSFTLTVVSAPTPGSMICSLFTSDVGVDDTTALPIGTVDQMIDSFLLLDALDPFQLAGTQGGASVQGTYSVAGAFVVCLLENINPVTAATIRVFMRGLTG